MSGYLIAVIYKDNGVTPHTTLMGIENGMYPNQATAIQAAKDRATAIATAKGQIVTNLAALVSATR
jgi:hypothetical protein